MSNKVVVNKRSRDPKTYTFTLRLSDLVWAGIGAALALTIFFLFGLLIGRGYLPATPGENTSPALEYQTDVHGQTDANGTPQVAEEPVVLQPEDLHYPEKIKQNETGKAQNGTEQQATPAAQAAEKPAPAKAKQVKPEQPAPAEEGAAFSTPEATPGEQTYNYVYQVAAFKDGAQAEALRGKLAAKGLEAAVAKGSVKGQVWHRVQVLFTGTPSQTDPLRDTVQQVTGQKPIRLSKKAVN